MDKKIKKAIWRAKQKSNKKLTSGFDLGFIRNASFAVGTEFSSARMSLQEPSVFPVVVPLQGRLMENGTEIENYRPFRMARTLIRMGVSVLLVAGDTKFLGGDASHINLVKAGSDVSVILNDFIIDEVQIYHAKSIGADGLILDSELIEASKLPELTEITYEVGLEAFIRLRQLSDLDGIDVETLGGIIVDESMLQTAEGADFFRRFREDHPQKIPVLLNLLPGSSQELAAWREKGIDFFLLPESWVLGEKPFERLGAALHSLWPDRKADEGDGE